VKQSKFEKSVSLYPNPELEIFSRTGCLCFTLFNEERQSVWSRGMEVWMSLTIVIYILISVFLAFLEKKKGFFGKKNVFLVESLIFFLGGN
jgi:hypothetical protein